MMLFKRRKVKKQEALFTESLKEAGYDTTTPAIRINHESGKCYYHGEEFNIVFPLRYLRNCKQLDYTKKYDFGFRGMYTSKRDWVRKFNSPKSTINFTDQGRKIEKHFFDLQYYQELAHTKFTLCPAGDFLWTYRFLEAIMCRSVPVIEPGAENLQCEGFKYLLSNKEPEELLMCWEEQTLIHNYSLFLKRHTLIGHFIFL